MKTTNTNKASTYRLPTTTTPENLETRLMGDRGTILTFGDRILVAGYFYNPNGRCYFAATYRFITADRTCEGGIKLTAIAEDTFEDNGHAIAWAMAH